MDAGTHANWRIADKTHNEQGNTRTHRRPNFSKRNKMKRKQHSATQMEAQISFSRTRARIARLCIDREKRGFLQMPDNYNGLRKSCRIHLDRITIYDLRTTRTDLR